MTGRAVLLAIALATAAAAADPPPPRAPAVERCLYIPPALADRVVFYLSFDGGVDKPEINALGGRFGAGDAAPAPGVAGRGADVSGPAGKRGVSLSGLALPLHKPLTVSLWWKVREPMRQDTGFDLVYLFGQGYIAHFVRSGPWCGLKEPTFVTQVYNWPGVSNINGIDDGPGRAEAGVWHHVAVVVAKGSQVSVYWDGVRRSDFTFKGRTLGPQDLAKAVHFGPQGAGHPMTLDELMILDVALDAPAVGRYIEAVRQLSAAGMPVLAPAGNSPDKSGG